MAYTAPTTRSTSDLITASIWNTDLVNNISFLANPPACAVYHSAAQSIAHATETALSFNSERYDTDPAAMHDTVTNNSRITIKTAGLYVVTGNAQFAANATGERILSIWVNGATNIARVRVGANGTAQTVLLATRLYKFAVNDYVTLNAYQSSGAALNVDATGNYTPEFSAVWVGLG